MIRHWLNSGRARVTNTTRQRNANQRKDFGHFEQLEDRRLLAFSSAFDGTTLTLTQTVDDGNIVIDNIGAGDAFRATDGAGTFTFVAATNLTVDLISSTGNQLDVALDNAHTGDVTLNLGDGARTANLTGTGNSIGGSLAVTSGTANQVVEVAVNADLNVTGSASFSLGDGFDVVDEDGNDVTIGADLNMTGVNFFENNGTMNVTGNVVYDNSVHDGNGDYDNDNVMNIGGDFTYMGNDASDNVNTNADFNLTGNYMANTAQGLSNYNINTATIDITGNVTLIATDTGSVDDLDMVAGLTIGGDMSVDFGGGTNNADFFGTFNGSTVSYTGTDGVDTVNYDFSGNPADVTIDLGDGDDDFTLGPNASIAPTTLDVNFGDDNDTYTNNFGAFTFDAVLSGLFGFDYAYDSTTDSLTATEVSNAGAVEFDNNGLGQAFRFNNGTATITPASNLSVSMLGGTGSALAIDLDFALIGDLSVDLGDGARDLNFIGFDNSIGGNLAVTGGADAQDVEVAVNNNLAVGGNASFDLGDGFDQVDEDGSDITITGDLNLTGVNEFEPGGATNIGGNVNVDTSAETETTRFDDDGALNVTGDLTYTGGDGRDEVLLNGLGGAFIGGNVMIDMGDNTAGGTQFAWFNAGGITIDGSLTILSTNSASADDVLGAVSSTVNGDITVNLGDGPNDADFLGVFGGVDIRYTGGSDADTVDFGMTGTPANVDIRLGAGDDFFVLDAGAAISPTTLRVDFGGGNDTFTNNYGAFDFNASLVNWYGYNRHYTFAEDIWNMTQIMDTGDVTIDNNGAGGAIRLLNGAVTEMSPASNVRLNLLDNSSTNVTVDFDNAHAGDLVLQLRHGPRDVMFTGTSNMIGGSAVVLGGDDVQNFHVAVNADISVGGDFVLNGRDGADVVDEGANNIDVGNNFIFRGINSFVNNNTVNVGGNFNMVSSLETEDTLLDNDGVFNVAGGINYIGGAGVDNVLLNAGGVNVGLTLYVDLADASDPFNKQNVSFAGGVFAGQISVVGGDSTGGNGFLADAATNVAGNVIVVFTGSTTANTAIFEGTYSGTYGTYRGGSAADAVSFGALAEDMTFVALMEGGNDTFTLEATTDLLSLLVDFGDNDDTFNDNHGMPYGFPVTLLNLP